MSDARLEAANGCEVCGAAVKDSARHAAWHRDLIAEAVQAAEASQERKARTRALGQM
ncbi:hypothetical protein [Knoellia koreensis]|uniref:Uncharacterized protein n=1 Tax=Knoellia koreensis TaxID=2730921 RepID=A0A849HCZ2_9MICO|nr:hypothetical protein [Knoellia sp. DB2414S]NNM44513.1 hypothetical protein [Knoellia sp. DB2414S]